MRRNFSAFTLAEVLITLGIIGVVAAMTMPTLMNSTQGAQYKAAYKKALSALGQAVTLNVALDGGNFADTEAGIAGKTDKATSGAESIASILNSRMNIVKASGKPDDYTPSGNNKDALPNVDTYLFFNDGIMFAFPSASKECSMDTASGKSADDICEGFLDVNGLKGPNKVVQCDGTYKAGGNCTVSNPTDIYPVVFYDQTILPGTKASYKATQGDDEETPTVKDDDVTAAAKAVLYGK